MGWNEAKREATSYERRLEETLSQYTRVEVNRSDPETVSDAERHLEREVEITLKKLAESIEEMIKSSEKPATSHAQIQRLREIMFDQKTKFRATQNRLKQVRESEALRKLMQRDLHHGEGDDVAQQMLMRERNSIANSSRIAGEIIDQAVEAHSELVSQRAIFTGTTAKLVDIGRRVPGIDMLIKRIEDKRTRDNTILALVIAFCTCFMLWYWLSGWGI